MNTRSAVLRAHDRPLEIEDLEMPALESGQVLVKVVNSGVCRSQLMETRGLRGKDSYLPHLLGHEGSGIVVETGKAVRKVKPGDKVVLTWIKGTGADCKGVTYRAGVEVINAGPITTFGEYSVISENRCVPFSQHIPMEVAALLGCAVLTGGGIVLNTLRPEKGTSIVIWGAGGIGLSALMAAKLSGCGVIIAVDQVEQKLRLAHEFGATHLVDSLSENPLSRVAEIVGVEGVDFAVEASGQASSIEKAFMTVRKNGGLCVFASHPPEGERISLNPHDLISGKNIKGSWGGESRPDTDIARFIDYYVRGQLPLERLITRRYGLNEINVALDDLEQGRVGRPMIFLEGRS